MRPYVPEAMDKTDFDDLLSRVKEIDELLQFPSLSGHIERANRLAVSIARSAPSPIPNLAMLVSNTANDIRQNPKDREAQDRVREAIARLRAAIEDRKSRLAD
jgi:hypothetical protein